MKKIIVTYHMRNDEETAETAIALPICDKYAEKEMESVRNAALKQIIGTLCILQGYSFDGICTVEVCEESILKL